jgi:hypothetical protein
MAPDVVLSPIWTDLGNLFNNYCDARAQMIAANSTNSSNSSSNATAAALAQLDIPWAEWKQDALASWDDLVAWLGRYQQYLAAALA